MMILSGNVAIGVVEGVGVEATIMIGELLTIISLLPSTWL